ncbi:MAG: AAA family ATPase, partial [Lachnoclostridium sp.]|jgi:cell division protease FtsH|nr:AAA family ATPase [Lachnoclostridium sp.]
MQVPEEEKYLMKKDELLDQIVTYYGGRAAEEINFESITTGAANDIEKATALARSMVTQYGMSDKFGMVGLETIESKYLDSRPVMNCGDQTESKVDKEVMLILNNCYSRAKEILSEYNNVLEILAKHLVEKETITGKEFVQIFEENTDIKLKRSGDD